MNKSQIHVPHFVQLFFVGNDLQNPMSIYASIENDCIEA